MKVASLSGSLRENVGKKSSKALRNAGLVPCVLYGHGEQVVFSAKRNDLDKLVFTPYVYEVEIEISGKKYSSVIKDLQQDPVTGNIMHVDFLKLDISKAVRFSIPIKLHGTARGVLAGGKLSTPYRKLNVLGLPKDLPDFIDVTVSDLRIGQAIRITDINSKNDKLTFLDPQNAVVVAVRASRGAAEGSDHEDEAEAEAPKAEA